MPHSQSIPTQMGEFDPSNFIQRLSKFEPKANEGWQVNQIDAMLFQKIGSSQMKPQNPKTPKPHKNSYAIEKEIQYKVSCYQILSIQ